MEGSNIMAFDDLSISEYKLIIELLESQLSGKYSPEFDDTGSDERGWLINLEGIDGNKDKKITGLTEGDLINLSVNRYIHSVKKGSKIASILSDKAFEQYHLSKEASSLSSPKAINSLQTDMQRKEKSIDIFISHSSKDKDVAKALINLLRAALNIPAHRIRCTSVDGYRLPAGASTDDQLRQEIYEARAFIGLITPTSFQSTYVLFELGARWGAGLHIAPVLAAGAESSLLRGPLMGFNALSCDVAAQIYQLADDLATALEVTVDSPSAYQKEIEALVAQSAKGKEQINNQGRPTAASVEASVFSTIEEREFPYIYKKLDRSLELTYGVYKQGSGTMESRKAEQEVYKTNLLSAIIGFIKEGYHMLSKYNLEYLLLTKLDKTKPLTEEDGLTRTTYWDSINNDVVLELLLEMQTYGLARLIKGDIDEPTRNVLEFTDKIHRFNYWLEYNGKSIEEIPFELVSRTPI